VTLAIMPTWLVVRQVGFVFKFSLRRRFRYNPNMSNDDKKKRSGFGWFVFVIFILVSYPLSVEPAVWMLNKGYIPDSLFFPLTSFYYPLKLLYDASTTVESFFDWYLGLFGI